MKPSSNDVTSTLIRERHLCSALALHKSTLRRMCLNGSFPLPLRVGKRAIAWRRADVEAWLAGRDAARGPRADGQSE